MKQIEQQIFIGGCSRSGTTLLGAMLGAHSAAICTPESHFKIDVLRSSAVQNDQLDMAAATDFINRHWRFQIWEMPLEVDHDISPAFPSLMNAIASQYAAKVGRPDASIWIDHTPENISYTHTLLAQFPQAKMIHLVRDGRAVAASIMPLDWGPNSIIKASRWWMRMVSFGLAAESTFGPQKVMQIRYEDLVQNPAGSLQKICRFLNLDYTPDMTKATGFIAPRYTTRQHSFIGKEPDAALATRWQNKLKPRDIEIFENMTRDFLIFLGYPLQYGLKGKGPSFMEIQKGKVSELVHGEIMNKVKWLIRSYPLWLKRDFYRNARLSDTNN
ncbi:MAG: sulfotransferase [Chloroflexi bacterium]|nr:sulfotransferase [Chloroflexota bacterium]